MLVTALLAVAPFVGLAACMVLHVGIARAAPRLPRLEGIGASVVGGLAMTVGLVAVGPTQRLPGTTGPAELAAVWLMTYLLLVYCYIIGFFNLGESARRIRLLIELHEAGPRGLSLDEILSTYNARMIVDVRLQRMIAGGRIRERDGAYFTASPIMLAAARVLVWLKLAFLGSRTEHEAWTRRRDPEQPLNGRVPSSFVLRPARYVRARNREA